MSLQVWVRQAALLTWAELTCMLSSRHATGWSRVTSEGPLSSHVLQQSCLLPSTWCGQGHDTEQSAHHSLSFGHENTSTSFCWLQRVGSPTQIRGVEKDTPSLDGKSCKVTLQRSWLQQKHSHFCNQSTGVPVSRDPASTIGGKKQAS